MQNNQSARLIVTLPPRHSKSLTASQLFPAWVLGKDPTLPFILTTYGSELSEKLGLGTRDIVASEAYQSIFPQTKLRKDVKSKRKWQTEHGGSYTAVGIGGAVTGTGGKIILIDDPFKDRAEAENKLTRDRVWEYYTSTLYSRLQGNGAIIILMQRWSTDDLVARVLDQAEEKKEANEHHDDWEVVNLPAVAEEDEYIDGVKTRKEGEPLWKHAYPLETLENIKSQMGTYYWISQYQQHPIAVETQEFRQDMFRYFADEDVEEKNLTYYTVVDPAISQRKEADNTCVLTVGKDKNSPNIYRIREDAGHYTPTQTVDLIFKHQQDYNSTVYVEKVAYQQALRYSVEEEQRRKEHYFSVKDFSPKGKKEDRIRELVALYERGVIFHRHTDKNYEEELITFPRGKRDDRIDAMSMVKDVVKQTKSTKKGKVMKPKHQGYFRKHLAR